MGIILQFRVVIAFLFTDSPEVKMLGILANFGNDDNYGAVESIVKGVRSTVSGDFAAMRSFKQLRILVQLRSILEKQLDKAMESVSVFFKEENDFLYRKGEAKGRIAGEIKGEASRSRMIIENMISRHNMSDEEIADLVLVSQEFVLEVREGLERK